MFKHGASEIYFPAIKKERKKGGEKMWEKETKRKGKIKGKGKRKKKGGKGLKRKEVNKEFKKKRKEEKGIHHGWNPDTLEIAPTHRISVSAKPLGVRICSYEMHNFPLFYLSILMGMHILMILDFAYAFWPTCIFLSVSCRHTYHIQNLD